MKNQPDWEEARHAFETLLQRTIERVKATHPAIIADLSSRANDVCVGGTVSFERKRDPQGDCDCEVSVTAFFSGDVLRTTSDVADGEGRILAEGPAVDIPLAQPADAFQAAFAAWLRDVERFVVDHAPAVVAKLLG